MRAAKRKTVIEEIPKTDSRIKRLTAEMNRYGKKPDALIEILHMVQDIFGYVPTGVMAVVSREMKIPPSRVYGAVTFYHFFTLKPKGEHNCLVCTGTACYVKGAQAIIDRVSRHFAIAAGETTPDNKLGLQTARCIGSCGLAPVVIVDNEIHAKALPEAVVEKIEKVLKP